jgi:transcriptional regulator with PAS, ATPase and Fis domain
MVSEADLGTFRSDLYYRIAAFPIRIPPLRDRGEDVLLIAEQLLRVACRRSGKRIRGLEPAAQGALTTYRWPGNVRELQNEIERAVAIAEHGESITLRHLSARLRGFSTPATAGRDGAASEEGAKLRGRTEAFERAEIEAALRRHHGNKTRSAAELGITPQGLLKKMRRLGMID